MLAGTLVLVILVLVMVDVDELSINLKEHIKYKISLQDLLASQACSVGPCYEAINFLLCCRPNVRSCTDACRSQIENAKHENRRYIHT